MALVPLTLFCSPNDVFDYVGVEGAQLRLDDHSLATGQTIKTTAAAAIGATTLAVTALQYPLLAGSVLEFDGGGTTEVVEAILTAVATVGSTSLTVAALPVAIAALAQAQDSGVNLATAQRLTKGCQYGTSQVKLYCNNRYDDSVLAQSWSVNRWSTYLAGRWVAKRRGQTAPKGIEQDVEEALDELRQVRTGMLCIEDIGTRTSGWPFISNVTVDIGYNITKVRVEQPISELTPTQYGQYVDWSSVLGVEY